MAKSPKERAQRFANRLLEALGDNLVAVVLYGSAARGDWVPGRSDVNVLVVLRDASAAALRPAAAAFADWVRDREPPPLVFAEDEWRRSADVFALEIEDMRAAHEVLAGRDPLEDVKTMREHLRHQLERELRGKLLHLRSGYAAAASDGQALAALVRATAPTVFMLCRATVRLAGREPPTERRALAAAAAAVAGFEATALDWALAALGDDKARKLEPHDAAAQAYVAAVEQMARYIDES